MSRVTIDDGILTDIADAIRTQYQDDSPISPLDFADAILEIDGGGGETLPFNMSSGEIELMSDEVDALTIEHNYGAIPNIILLWCDGFSDRTAEDTKGIKPFTSVACMSVQKSDGTIFQTTVKTWVSNNQGVIFNTNYGGVTYVNENMFTVATRANNYPWRKELTYKWLAIYW